MATRNQLRTARFSREEAQLVDKYIKTNQIFESFSSLARVATMQFIQERESLPLVKQTSSQKNRPKFIWDYDLSEYDVREILSLPGFSEKKLWLISRILSEARFDETLRYLDINTIAKTLPMLHIKDSIRERWQYATERWLKND